MGYDGGDLPGDAGAAGRRHWSAGGSDVNVHICANYKAKPGHVFVANVDGEGWHQSPAATADTERIIRCHCRLPATSLDHLWPYDSTYNRCEKHRQGASPAEGEDQ